MPKETKAAGDTKLALDGNVLTGAVPAGLSEATLLSTLLLNNNYLSEESVPDEVCDLRAERLVEFIVDCNRPICRIPACCTACT